MKRLIIPTLIDTYGLIKFWDFDAGPPAANERAKREYGRNNGSRQHGRYSVRKEKVKFVGRRGWCGIC